MAGLEAYKLFSYYSVQTNFKLRDALTSLRGRYKDYSGIRVLPLLLRPLNHQCQVNAGFLNTLRLELLQSGHQLQEEETRIPLPLRWGGGQP